MSIKNFILKTMGYMGYAIFGVTCVVIGFHFHIYLGFLLIGFELMATSVFFMDDTKAVQNIEELNDKTNIEI